MNKETAPDAGPQQQAMSRRRAGVELFLISVLILFLELVCIRWFPAHVLFLTFFTNTVLLASFLGMSVGCLAARYERNFLPWTPVLLALALAVGHEVEALRVQTTLQVGSQTSPQMIFFGTESQHSGDVDSFTVPIEAVGGFFFLIIALVMVGPGQELGRALARIPDRVRAYSVNIFGSVLGIVLFGACSWAELPPLWWFVPAVLGLGYFLAVRVERGREVLLPFASLAVVLGLAAVTSGYYPLTIQSLRERLGLAPLQEGTILGRHFWSPYYRIDYDYAPRRPGEEPPRSISVNLIGHQQMRALDSPFPAYALPYLFNRDAGGAPFQDVLIIGAGSGNDVSRALQWGARSVDAVEIDPVIQRLGERDHPDAPYRDPRVTKHLDDGRNFLRVSGKKYDLIVYALVDSLVLHSSYSNIRLESYLFTRQAVEDVKRHLKPTGVFAVYNYFRRGWLVSRLQHGLEEVFQGQPLVFTLPYQPTVEPDQESSGFTLLMVGDTAGIRGAFERTPEYWIDGQVSPGPTSPDGFQAKRAAALASPLRFGLTTVIPPAETQLMATDDWPFLYLRRPLIPLRPSLSGMAVMAGLSLLLIIAFLLGRPPEAGGRPAGGWGLAGRMFFLGAGFMLIETKAVVHMALLFGSTWVVNSVVFFAVLVMILAANLFVLQARPARLPPYYAGLALALIGNLLVPLDWFLGLDRTVQVVGSCLLVFAPILFAAVIFAVSFGQSLEPDRDFGANIAGAILGGLTEYSSMVLGFQYLIVLALLFYALSAVLGPGPSVLAKPAGD